MLTTQHRQEALCRAHIIALAGHAGVNYELGAGFDYGVDCTIRQIVYDPERNRRVPSGFSVEIQLKSSTQWKLEQDSVVYDLEAKTWNDMVGRDPAAIPLYLGLLCLPEAESDWLQCVETELILKHCCYYFRPKDAAPTNNTDKIRVRIPRSNILDPKALSDLLVTARAEARGEAS